MPRYKNLIHCIEASHARDLRSKQNKGPNDPVSDGDVIKYMKGRAAFLPDDARRVMISNHRYAERWNDIENYRRRANSRDVKNGIAKKKGELIPDARAAINAMIATDKYEMRSDWGLQSKQSAVFSEAMMVINDLITELRPKGGLLRNRHFQDNLVYAMFGDERAPAKYRKLYDGVFSWNKGAVERFNVAVGHTLKEGESGLSMGMLNPEDFPMPMETDFNMLKKVTEAEWRRDIERLGDLEKMGVVHEGILDNRTGNALNLFYRDAMEDGMASRNVDESRHEHSFIRRHSNQRFLKFKDADSWLEYNKKYSKLTPYASLMDHVSATSREIATREMFGPSPDSTFQKLQSNVMDMTGDKNAANAAKKGFDNVTGNLSPIHSKMADGAQAMRNWSSASHLGGAALSTPPDMLFNAGTASYNGFPIFRSVKNHIKALSWNSHKDQQFAARLGFILENALDDVLATSRYADVSGKGISSAAANFVMKASGLSHVTHAGKMSYWRTAFQTYAEDLRGNEAAQRMFRRYNITERDQAIMLSSKSILENGVEYLDPINLPRELREKIAAMTHSEMKLAIPEPDAHVQAFLNQGQPRGEAGGELLRFGGQFKAFQASVAILHGSRALHGFEGNSASRLGYAGTLLASTTAIGIGVVQLKELSKGNKPLDWNSSELYYRGMLAGGLFVVVGDIILTDSSRFGQSVPDYLMGPVASDITKILLDGMIGGVYSIKRAEKTYKQVIQEFGSDAVEYIPGQFWYLRLALDRSIKGALQEAIDPSFRMKEMEREIRRRQKPGTNERWWK